MGIPRKSSHVRATCLKKCVAVFRFCECLHLLFSALHSQVMADNNSKSHDRALCGPLRVLSVVMYLSHGWEKPVFLKKNNPPSFFGSFLKNSSLSFLKETRFRSFLKKTQKNILNCFYSSMQYHYFQDYSVITCYTYYGIQNWGSRNVPHRSFRSVLLVSLKW